MFDEQWQSRDIWGKNEKMKERYSRVGMILVLVVEMQILLTVILTYLLMAPSNKQHFHIHYSI